jgi:hypothetical protein
MSDDDRRAVQAKAIPFNLWRCPLKIKTLLAGLSIGQEA